MSRCDKIQPLEFAFEAGFDSHEAFSRAFKKACGVSPSQFRKVPDWHLWKLQPYKKLRGIDMKVDVKTIEAIRTAAVKHQGPFALLHDTATKLIFWSEENKLPLKQGECFGIVYNDPETTPDGEFCFDFCRQIPNNMVFDEGDIYEHIIPAGHYAVARHLGSHDKLGDTVKYLYREWLPNNGEELRDIPCFFQYHNFAHEVQESALITDVYLPIE